MIRYSCEKTVNTLNESDLRDRWIHERFLKEHHHGTYTSMLLTGRLEPHLREIDRQAQQQVDRIVGNLKRLHGVDETLKSNDQMAWVQSVNSFIAQAEEMVLPEILYY